MTSTNDMISGQILLEYFQSGTTQVKVGKSKENKHIYVNATCSKDTMLDVLNIVNRAIYPKASACILRRESRSQPPGFGSAMYLFTIKFSDIRGRD